MRVALPQIMPRLIESVRLSLGPAFLFLIAAEAIAADVGLGYRIFLVRRYLAMDVILPYVAWITLLAYLMDFALAWIARRSFPWAYAQERSDERARRFAMSGSSTATRSCSSAINLEIAAGAFLSVVGPSGCGKSTFLRLILGQERPTRGTISIDGTPLPAGARARSRRRVPALFGVPASHGARQCADRLRIRRKPGPRRACAARPGATRSRRASACLQAVGLIAHRDKYPSALSGGMQQRLAIAQALARRAARAPARRAVRRARSWHAHADACADPAALARARNDHDDGHARPQGSVRARHAAHRPRQAAPSIRRRRDASAPSSPTTSISPATDRCRCSGF